ncbi:MAG: 4Fe-4S binding protein [bacterium]
MAEDLYLRLREYLHSMPGGYPETPTGVEIRILKKLFTPADAELFLNLEKEPEDLAAIAARLGRAEPALAGELEGMAKRGLVFRTREGGRVRYKAYQFFVGIIEAQINRVDRELTELIEEYMPYLGAVGLALESRQMRVIPAQTAVDVKTSVAPYNRVRDVVQDDHLISLSPCICRQMSETKGAKCRHPYETCISFGQQAQFYIDNGIGRKIGKPELMAVLETAEKEGLVLSTTNTEDLSLICCCCTCCCGVLKGLQMLPQSSLMANICYQAEADPDLCTACAACVERCPMGAVTEAGETVAVNRDKCLGCGVCVAACPAGAISLSEVPGAKPPFPDHPSMRAQVCRERGLA